MLGNNSPSEYPQFRLVIPCEVVFPVILFSLFQSIVHLGIFEASLFLEPLDFFGKGTARFDSFGIIDSKEKTF